MPFGQQSGPPATARQIQELLELLQAAGHADFRDARGPLGFTQRQAAGRFTRDEANALAERLRDEADRPAGGAGGEQGASASASVGAGARAAGAGGAAAAARAVPLSAESLRRAPAGQLAAELTRRGWMVIEPLGDG